MSTDFKTLAKEACEKGNYKLYVHYAKAEYSLSQDHESLMEFQKAHDAHEHMMHLGLYKWRISRLILKKRSRNMT